MSKLPKKRNLTDCNNCRGTTLLSVPGKIMAMIIFERICETFDKKLRGRQADLGKGRTCADHIFVLSNLIEQSKEWRRQLVVHFIDFRKAFGSLYGRTVWNTLRSYGLPSKNLDMIKLLYDRSTSYVKVDSVNPERFEITTSVRQGDVLSPGVFNIVVD